MRITVYRISTWLRAVAEVSIGVYLTATALSLIVAHFILVLRPGSLFAEDIIAPVSRGLEFIDNHWKATLLVIAPLVWPVIRQLVLRVTKAGGFEFGAVHLNEVDRGKVPRSEEKNE
jgi:hypothetical protein